MENEEESISADQSDGDESDDIIIHKHSEHREDPTTPSPAIVVDPISGGAMGGTTEEDESCYIPQDLSIDDVSAIKITSTAKQFSVTCISVYTDINSCIV